MAARAPARRDHPVQMSEAEALMWHVEADERFSTAIGVLLLTDRALPADDVRRLVTYGVSTVPRLRQRVVSGGLTRLAPPVWRTDAEFELAYHVRRLGLPSPGTEAELFELVTRLMQDPFDRARPLWQVTVIEGLTGGRGAVLVKFHHTVTDGEGGVLLAERYLEATAAGSSLPERDLGAVLAEEVARERLADAAAGTPEEGPAPRSVADQAAGLLRGPLGTLRRLAGEALLTCADPERLPELADAAGDSVRKAVRELSPADPASHSPLWSSRSRRRCYLAFSVAIDPVRAAAKRFGASLNDVFVAAIAQGAHRYHERAGAPTERITVSFAISTRKGQRDVANAFTVARAVVPAGALSCHERVHAVTEALAAQRHAARELPLLASLAGLAAILPPGLVGQLARSQTAGVDVATSNIRGTADLVHLAGAEVLSAYPVGPVAGTAANATLLSYRDRLHVGLYVDPAAIAEPSGFADDVRAGFTQLVETDS